MIITSEHDFSSANTYIHLGYALGQSWNVAMHELTWPVSAREPRRKEWVEAAFEVTVGSGGWSLFMMFGYTMLL